MNADIVILWFDLAGISRACYVAEGSEFVRIISVLYQCIVYIFRVITHVYIL